MHSLAVILLAILLLGVFVMVLALLFVSLTLFIDTTKEDNQNQKKNGTL